jgi:GGDEF domain-containing protein
VARLGGDEFAIVLDGADDRQALAITEGLRRQLDEPFEVEGHPVELGASIGIAVYPSHGTSAVELLRRADIAMYAAKRVGGGAALYGPESRRDGHEPAGHDRRASPRDRTRALDVATGLKLLETVPAAR